MSERLLLTGVSVAWNLITSNRRLLVKNFFQKVRNSVVYNKLPSRFRRLRLMRGDKDTSGRKAYLAEARRDKSWLQMEVVDSSPVRVLGSRIRVGFLLTNSLPQTRSGYSIRSHQLLKAIRTVGIEISPMTRLGYPFDIGNIPRSSFELVQGVGYRRLLPGWVPRATDLFVERSVEEIAKRVEEEDLDILHTTTPFKNGVIISRVAAKTQRPWVYEIRGEPESTWMSKLYPAGYESESVPEHVRLSRKMETDCALKADAVVALSEISKSEFVRRGVPPEKITVIPNAVGTAEVGRPFNRQVIRQELSLSERSWIGTATAIVGYEGLDILVKSLKFLPKHYNVLIVGEGTERESLEELASDLGFRDRVYFAGYRDPEEIWQWYAAMEVFVVPRLDHPVCRRVTPIKPVLAQALGIPTVVSDLPALREVTGNVAFYFAPGDPEGLATAVCEASGSNASPGIGWAKQRTWQNNAEILKLLYKSVLQSSSTEDPRKEDNGG